MRNSARPRGRARAILAGLTLGLSVVIVRTFPEFGEGFRSLVIATVALNEKYSLDRTGAARSRAAG